VSLLEITSTTEGVITQWGVQVNCEKSQCKQKHGALHNTHGKIRATYVTEDAAVNYAADLARANGHCYDVISRKIVVPPWDKEKSELPEVKL
jgi:hypothetical protein